MARYQFVCKYVLDVDADNEDDAYDEAYMSMDMEGYNHEATLVRSF